MRRIEDYTRALQWFIDGYLAAALWTCPYDSEAESDIDGYLDARYNPDEIEPANLAHVANECADFLAHNWDDLNSVVDNRYTWGRAGHDFWLTRNGHGAGFWDRGFGAAGDRLSDAARAYGSAHAFRGHEHALPQPEFYFIEEC